MYMKTKQEAKPITAYNIPFPPSILLKGDLYMKGMELTRQYNRQKSRVEYAIKKI